MSNHCPYGLPVFSYHNQTIGTIDTKGAMTRQNQQNKGEHSKDPDQPGHLPGLIRGFTERSVGN